MVGWALRALLRLLPVVAAGVAVVLVARWAFADPPAPIRPALAPTELSARGVSTVEGSWPVEQAATPVQAFLVAEAINEQVHLFGAPGQVLAARSTLQNPTPEGTGLVFSVIEQQGVWVRVRLPVAPNGSQAWVLKGEVAIRAVPAHITVQLGARRLTVTKGTQVVLDVPVAVGRAALPTPIGTFFVEGLQPRSPGPEGPPQDRLITSAWSERVRDAQGQTEHLAFEPTNLRGAVGTAITGGSIWLTTKDFSDLYDLAPAGTPIDIVP